ncbi:hypothetical protein E5981_12320 [Bacteroides faecichinchillae]|nr:hypothetical protein E5981_12320 [Bacteroides faecichinchillae]
MNKKNTLCCIDYNLYNDLLLKLEKLEVKCDRITNEVSEVKKMISSLPPEVDTLIDSIVRSAKDLYSQSVAHRKYVEQCVSGKPYMHLIRRIDDGL